MVLNEESPGNWVREGMRDCLHEDLLLLLLCTEDQGGEFADLVETFLLDEEGGLGDQCCYEVLDVN